MFPFVLYLIRSANGSVPAVDNSKHTGFQINQSEATTKLDRDLHCQFLHCYMFYFKFCLVYVLFLFLVIGT